MIIVPCRWDCAVAVPMKPVTKAYVTTAAATAITMSSSVAIIGETPFLFLFRLMALMFYRHIFVNSKAGVVLNQGRIGDRRALSVCGN